MPDTRKNPLLGAFRAASPTEEKKNVEPSQSAIPDKNDTPPWDDGPKEGKSPTKTEEEKKQVKEPVPTEDTKSADQTKAPKDDKPPTAAVKAGEEKKQIKRPKSTEVTKPADPDKEVKDDKSSTAKTGAEKENPEVKVSGAGKVIEIPLQKSDRENNDDPPKIDEEVDEDGIPKGFSMEIVPKEKLGQVTKLAVSYIDDFEGHPFPVRDDADMEALTKSIKQVGLLEPATVIPNPKKPGRFEMVSGHRRMHAAKQAGLTEIPVIIRNMDHDEATVYMVDSNLKREIPLTPMEKARAYTMRAEALKRKTGRRTKAETAALQASGKKPLTADEEIAKQTGESVAQVQRLKTLTKLTPPLQKMVDDKKLPVNTAVDIAQMKTKEQEVLADAISKEDKVPSGTDAKKLKEASKAGTLTTEKIEAAVAPTKREIEPPLKVTLMEEDLLPYFSKGTTAPDIKKGIFEGLEVRKKLIDKKKTQEQEAKKKPPSQGR